MNKYKLTNSYLKRIFGFMLFLGLSFTCVDSGVFGTNEGKHSEETGTVTDKKLLSTTIKKLFSLNDPFISFTLTDPEDAHEVKMVGATIYMYRLIIEKINHIGTEKVAGPLNKGISNPIEIQDLKEKLEINLMITALEDFVTKNITKTYFYENGDKLTSDNDGKGGSAGQVIINDSGDLEKNFNKKSFEIIKAIFTDDVDNGKGQDINKFGLGTDKALFRAGDATSAGQTSDLIALLTATKKLTPKPTNADEEIYLKSWKELLKTGVGKIFSTQEEKEKFLIQANIGLQGTLFNELGNDIVDIGGTAIKTHLSPFLSEFQAADPSILTKKFYNFIAFYAFNSDKTQLISMTKNFNDEKQRADNANKDLNTANSTIKTKDNQIKQLTDDLQIEQDKLKKAGIATQPAILTSSSSDTPVDAPKEESFFEKRSVQMTGIGIAAAGIAASGTYLLTSSKKPSKKKVKIVKDEDEFEDEQQGNSAA